MVVDDEEKANILNTFFSTVFTVENKMLGEIPRNNENPILRVTNLTQEEVRNRLNKIKIDKSPGPDGIHPRVLRELSNVIDKPLFLIFRDSIAMVPIFKKGSKSEPGNYRPVSLTSIVGKIFEGFLKDVILDYLNEKNCLTPYQHGFMRNRSCQTNLISFYEETEINELETELKTVLLETKEVERKITEEENLIENLTQQCEILVTKNHSIYTENIKLKLEVEIQKENLESTVARNNGYRKRISDSIDRFSVAENTLPFMIELNKKRTRVQLLKKQKEEMILDLHNPGSLAVKQVQSP
ncbi:unnamed protein product [Ranitomeya imitator]|uniref:Reverse transcriptase domain-containing protein n=1 Tax=Ranitomeya imitator TaxID=111125 RepID=A0ABN9LCM8_9NEOB|nr:unnamed protein product [Ranitomeya imitator]